MAHYLTISCPFGNLQASCYTKLMNGLNLQYNDFFKNDVIFSPWNHDAIT